MSDFKVAIIGCGNVARIHLPYVLRHIPREQIAICDCDQVRLKDFSEHSEIQAAYDDVNIMLDEFKPTIAHILTSPSTHKNLAITCIENGCHVLIEKPMCLSVAEAEEIVDVSRRNKAKVCVDHSLVYSPHILRLKELLNTNALGRILHISAVISDDVLKRIQKGLAVRWVSDLPGGAFFDLLPHPLSIFITFLPNLVLESSCQQRDTTDSITDLTCHFSSDKGSAFLHMSLNLFPLQHQYTFECEKGIVKVDLRNFLTTINKQGYLPDPIQRISGKVFEGAKQISNSLNNVFKSITGRLDSYSGLDAIVKTFYQAILNNDESPVSAQQGKLVVSLINQIFPNAKTKPKKLPYSMKFNDYHKPQILVTGGTGFIGRKLVKRLLENNNSVRVFAHRLPSQTDNIFNNKVELVHGDIHNYENVCRAVEGIKTIYHLAAATSGNWNYHLDTTVTGTKNVLKAAKLLGVKKLVYTSTLSVLHSSKYPNNKTIDESFQLETLPKKRGCYTNAKLQAEALVREEMSCNDLSIFILRPGLVYGTGKEIITQDVGFRLGRKFLLLFGFGRRSLPLIYIENLVDALVLVGESNKSLKGIYNVVDDNSPTQKDILNFYKNNTNDNFIIIPVPKFLFTITFWILDKVISKVLKKNTHLLYKFRSYSKSVIHSSNKIKKDFGWESKIDWRKGLKRIINNNFV